MKVEYYLQIEYNMISNVSGYDPDRYVNKYPIKVSARTLEEDTYEEVGRGFVVLILDGLIFSIGREKPNSIQPLIFVYLYRYQLIKSS